MIGRPLTPAQFHNAVDFHQGRLYGAVLAVDDALTVDDLEYRQKQYRIFATRSWSRLAKMNKAFCLGAAYAIREELAVRQENVVRIN